MSHKKTEVCPNCGHCPHCGQSPQRTLPYNPWYPPITIPSPFWEIPPTTSPLPWFTWSATSGFTSSNNPNLVNNDSTVQITVT